VNDYSPIKTGKYAWEVDFLYTYIYCTYWIAPPLMAEKIYTANTTIDLRGIKLVYMGSWSGKLPGYNYFYWMRQDSTIKTSSEVLV